MENTIYSNATQKRAHMIGIYNEVEEVLLRKTDGEREYRYFDLAVDPRPSNEYKQYQQYKNVMQ